MITTNTLVKFIQIYFKLILTTEIQCVVCIACSSPSSSSSDCLREVHSLKDSAVVGSGYVGRMGGTGSRDHSQD